MRIKPKETFSKVLYKQKDIFSRAKISKTVLVLRMEYSHLPIMYNAFIRHCSTLSQVLLAHPQFSLLKDNPLFSKAHTLPKSFSYKILFSVQLSCKYIKARYFRVYSYELSWSCSLIREWVILERRTFVLSLRIQY